MQWHGAYNLFVNDPAKQSHIYVYDVKEKNFKVAILTIDSARLCSVGVHFFNFETFQSKVKEKRVLILQEWGPFPDLYQSLLKYRQTKTNSNLYLLN